MGPIKTDAIVLRTIAYSETSQVVALCTRDHGQVHLLMKGARRPRKDGRGPLDLLFRCQVVFSPRSRTGLYTATDWCVTRTYRRLAQELDRFFVGLHACELVLAATRESEPEAGAYAELETLLERLDAGDDPAEARFAFEMRLLRALGLAPGVQACSQCGGPFGERPRFSARAGGVVCSPCGVADASSCAISPGAVAAMRRFVEMPAGGQPRVLLSSAQRREIDRALREHFEWQLGRALRTARYVEEKPHRAARPGTGVWEPSEET